jgi:hypothetical protein
LYFATVIVSNAYMQDVLEQLTRLLFQEKKFVASDGQLLKKKLLIFHR